MEPDTDMSDRKDVCLTVKPLILREDTANVVVDTNAFIGGTDVPPGIVAPVGETIVESAGATSEVMDIFGTNSNDPAPAIGWSDFLNLLASKDPVAIEELIHTAVPCNQGLAAWEDERWGTPKSEQSDAAITLIGILNSYLLGTGFVVTSKFDDDSFEGFGVGKLGGVTSAGFRTVEVIS